MPKPVVVDYFELDNEDGTESSDQIASISINRPQSANAFSGEILDAISESLETIAANEKIRVLLFQSVGKHFSAGADLSWMRESAKLSIEHNRREALKLTAMFERLSTMPMPTIAIAKGAAYGGAVGIVACCDYAFALEGARFCLSEVRVGLIPAVIVPYLSRKMRSGDLRRLTLTGKVFEAEEALSTGLVQSVQGLEEIENFLHSEVNLLLGASPEAQMAYKKLQSKVRIHGHSQIDDTAEAIANIRASEMGQEGLSSFFEKRKPLWNRKAKLSSKFFQLP